MLTGAGAEPRRRYVVNFHEVGKQACWYDNNLSFVPEVWIARQKGWHAKHWNMDGYLIYSQRSRRERPGRETPGLRHSALK